MNKNALFTFLLFLYSCNTSDQSNIKVERVSVDAEIITDSIHSSLPGVVIVINNYVVWQDVFASGKFLHVIDLNTKKEVGILGDKGQGPKEFSSPNVSKALNNRLFVFDYNTKRQAFFSIENLLSGKDYYSPIPNNIKVKLKDNFRIIEFEENQFVTLRPGSDYLLEHWNKRLYYSFGPFPIPETLCKRDRFDFFQGNIAYNSDLNKLVYSSYRFPYLAIYTKRGKYFKLHAEVKRMSDYSVSPAGELNWGPNKKRGPVELTLTSDYIVTVERDPKIDQTNEDEVGVDQMKLPHTVYLYDYDGNLKKIVDLGYPVLRIAADIKNNILYAIVVMEDFVLVKYEL